MRKPIVRPLVGVAVAIATALTLAGVVGATTRNASSSPTLAQLQADIARSAALRTIPNLLTTIPPITATAWDLAQPYPTRPACYLKASPALPANPVKACSLGDATASRTILLIGDSHAAMLAPALDVVGRMLRWHVVWLTMVACYPWLDPNIVDSSGNSTAACHTFRKGVIAYANRAHPAVIMPVGIAGTYGLSNWPTVPQLEAEMKSLISALKPSHSKIVLVGRTPDFRPVNPDQCLATKRRPTACERTPRSATPPIYTPAVTAVAAAMKLRLVDLTPLFCTPKACPVLVTGAGGTHLIYLDSSHIYRWYSAWIGAALAKILAPDL